MGEEVTFLRAIKGGLIAGLIGAGLNNLWSLLAQVLGSVPPPGFPIAVTMSSIFPLMIGSILYFVLMKFFSAKGHHIFVFIAVVFTLFSLYPTISMTEMPDGTPLVEGFTLLTLPMHLISGALAVWGIPKFSNKQRG
jgi:Family of unknown function (DUF6069)